VSRLGLQVQRVLETLLQHRCDRVQHRLPPQTLWVADGRIAIDPCWEDRLGLQRRLEAALKKGRLL
jgi:hypothetical protein